MTDLTQVAPATLSSIALELSEIAELSYTDPLQAIDRLSAIHVPKEFDYLKDAVFTHVVWAKQSGRDFNEFVLQRKFFASLGDLIQGAIRISHPVIREHQPDGFVEIHGDLYVVEVKLNAFLASSLQQLKRYISEYDAAGGIAVAPELRCLLPSNVMFVSLSINGGAA